MSEIAPSPCCRSNRHQDPRTHSVQSISSTSSVVPLLLDEKWSPVEQGRSLYRSNVCESGTQSSLLTRTSSTCERIASAWDPLSQSICALPEEGGMHDLTQQVNKERITSRLHQKQVHELGPATQTLSHSFGPSQSKSLRSHTYTSYTTSSSETCTATSIRSDDRSTRPLLNSSTYDSIDRSRSTAQGSHTSATSAADTQAPQIFKTSSTSSCNVTLPIQATKSYLLPSSTVLGFDRFVAQPQSHCTSTNTGSARSTSSTTAIPNNYRPVLNLSTEELIDMMFNTEPSTMRQSGGLAELGSTHKKSVHWEDADMNRRATAIDEILDSYFPSGMDRLSQFTKQSFLAADGQACPVLRKKQSIRDLEKEAARKIFHAKSDWQDEGKISQFLKKTTGLHGGKGH